MVTIPDFKADVQAAKARLLDAQVCPKLSVFGHGLEKSVHIFDPVPARLLPDLAAVLLDLHARLTAGRDATSANEGDHG